MMKIKGLSRGLAATAVAFLAACASNPDAPVEYADIEDAVCIGDYALAADLSERAANEGMNTMQFHVLRGYALEQGGKLMSARPVYHSVIKTKSNENVALDCDITFNDDPFYDGPASQVAYDRMRMTNVRLAELDVTEDQLLAVNPIPAPVEPVPPPIPTHIEPPTVTAPPVEPMMTHSVSMGAGKAWIHLASYQNKKWESHGWQALTKKYRSLLDGHDKVFRQVDLGKKGKTWRLGAGGFASKADANMTCAKLKAAGQYCKVMTE